MKEMDFLGNLPKKPGLIAKGIASSGLSDFVQGLKADFSENHLATNCIFKKASS